MRNLQKYVFIAIFLAVIVPEAVKGLKDGELTDQYKQDAVAAVLKGILDANSVPNNNELANCFGPELIPVYPFIQEGVRDPITLFMDLQVALDKICGFMNILHHCITTTQEGQSLQRAYNLREGLLLDEVRDVVVAYAAFNPFDLDDFFDDAEENWNSQHFEEVGKIFAELGHEIVDDSDLVKEAESLIQQQPVKKHSKKVQKK